MHLGTQHNMLWHTSTVSRKQLKKLDQANTVSDKTEMLKQALYKFKESRDLEKALVNWNALPEQDKKWAKENQQGVS